MPKQDRITAPPGDLPSFSHRVLQASVWTLALRIALRSIGFIRNVILARVLAPDDIGLFGMALLILSVMERFSNTGVTAALVQRKEEIDDYLDTAWTVQILRSLGLAILLVVLAPSAAVFFEEPSVAPLIQVLGVTILLRGLSNPGVVCLRRELNVRSQFVLSFGGACVDLGISLTAAIVTGSVWGLMLGLTVGSVANLMISYAVHGYRPKPRFDLQQIRELSPFGVWVFLDNILFFLAYRGDNVVVGKLLGSAALGAYILAYGMSEALTTELGRVITEVAFPAYSRIQDNLERLKRGFFLAAEVTTSLALPAAVILVLLAEPITRVVLGDRWIAVAAVLPPLALTGALRSFLVNTGAVFNGIGRPSHAFRMNLVGVALTYTLMFPLASRMGLEGVGWALLGGVVVMLPLAALSSQRLLGLRPNVLLRPLVPGIVLSALVSAPLLFLRGSFDLDNPGGLTVSIAVAGLAYLVGVAFLGLVFDAGPLRIRVLLRRGRPPSVVAVESTA